MTFTGHDTGPGRHGTAGDRMQEIVDHGAELMRTQQTFDRAQVAWMIREALRIADEARAVAEDEVTELHLDALSRGLTAPAFTEKALRNEGYRQTARREWDAAAGWPWHGDHTGGALGDWLDESTERPDLPKTGASLRVRTVGGRLVWADA